jgi:predicted nicotinamide N-methyase
MDEELVSRTIELPNGDLRLLQPRESSTLPDEGAIEWAPIAPYWSILWRSGMTLAREVDASALRGRRVLELGCGLALPSIAAARGGAAVLATDADPDALELVARNADENGVKVETASFDWGEASAKILKRAPFDLVLASDILYERASVGRLLDLLPRLAPEAWLADPGRPAFDAFLEQAQQRLWPRDTLERGIVWIHRFQLAR